MAAYLPPCYEQESYPGAVCCHAFSRASQRPSSYQSLPHSGDLPGLALLYVEHHRTELHRPCSQLERWER